jgi:hypothetical protein
MDTIEYRCPLHGVVITRSRADREWTEDLLVCPFKHHPFDDECGRSLFYEFAQSSESQIAS